MIEIIIALAVALLGALGWGRWERKGKLEERDGRQKAERAVDLEADIRNERREVDQRMRDSEGDNDARDHRVTNANDFLAGAAVTERCPPIRARLGRTSSA